MSRTLRIFCWVFSYLLTSEAQILYQCNYDGTGSANNCLLAPGIFAILAIDKLGTIGSSPPITPLSDVTSSLTPTTNGLNCSLPYRISPFTWDMYFCNDGICPTATDNNTQCRPGKFGYFGFAALRLVSFVLNTGTGGIDGIGEQCLTYYYYLSNINGTQQNIRVIKQEVGNINNVTIDIVTNSSFNGWIKRQINYNAEQRGYTMYFEFQRATGGPSPTSTIAVDEFSIIQGSCPNGLSTSSMSTTTSTAASSTTSSTPTLTTEIESTTTTSESPTSMRSSIETTTSTTTSITSSTGAPTFSTTSITMTPIPTATETASTTSSASPTTSSTTTIVETTAGALPTTTSTTVIPVEVTTTTDTTSVAPPPTTLSTTSATPPSSPFPFTTTTKSVAQTEKPSSNNTLIIAIGTAVPLGLILMGGVAYLIKKRMAAAAVLKAAAASEEFTDIQDRRGTVHMELGRLDSISSF